MNNPVKEYARRALRVAWLILAIQAAIERQHERTKQIDEPNRLWGFIGNLEHAEEELLPLVSFLSGTSAAEITNALNNGRMRDE